MDHSQASIGVVSTDRSRPALEFAHRLLSRTDDLDMGLEEVARELTAAFACRGAGIFALSSGQPLLVYRTDSESTPSSLPWQVDPDLLSKIRNRADALAVSFESQSFLVADMPVAPGGWLLWIEDASRGDWTQAEKGALVLIAQLLIRRLTSGEEKRRFEKQLDRNVRQQHLEQAATLARRLAHEYGNVLTGILGFSELALAHPQSASAQLSRFINEIYGSAKAGAYLTHQLQLFSRRQATSNRKGSLSPVLAEEEGRFRSAAGTTLTWRSSIPADLPFVAIDQDPLREVISAVIDNAREAVAGHGTVEVSARRVELSAADCLDHFGSLRPGSHVEVSVADSGPGLSAEAQRQLFIDPFFTGKPRRRGFGLAISYGVISAYHGGLSLGTAPLGGVLARLLIPVTEDAAGRNVPAARSVPATRKRDEKVLVVDDDPLILQFVSLTLEQAGYRVKAVSSADEALDCYNSAASDPFQLVLSDVIMPRVSGVDLARQLFTSDANARILFMSGQVSPDFTRAGFADRQIDLLPKPFRPDGLLLAVRGALDRVPADGLPARRAVVEEAGRCVQP